MTRCVPRVCCIVAGQILNCSSIRCLTPELIRSTLITSPPDCGLRDTIETSYSGVNVAVSRLTVDVLLCFVHAPDDIRIDPCARQTVDPCKTVRFDATDADFLLRQLRAFFPFPECTTHAFLLYSLDLGSRTLVSAWPPHALCSTAYDWIDKQIQEVALDDLYSCHAPTACARRKVVETITPDGRRNGRAVLIPHGTRILLVIITPDTKLGLGDVMFVCHELYSSMQTTSASNLEPRQPNPSPEGNFPYVEACS